MSDEIELDGLATRVREQGNDTSTNNTRSVSIEEPEPGVVELVLSHLEPEEPGARLRDMVIPYGPGANVDNIPEIREEVKDVLDLPEDMDTFTFADLFQVDMSDYDYFGNSPRGNSNGEAEDPVDEQWKQADLKGNGNLINDCKTVLNGHNCQEIQERLAIDYPDADEDSPEVIIAVRILPRGDELVEDTDEGLEREKARRQYARFYVQDSDTAGKRALKYRHEVGDIESEAKKEELVAKMNGEWEEEEEGEAEEATADD